MYKKTIKFYKLVLIIIITSCGSGENSNLKLMDIFSNGMVLQQKATTKIWGISNPNEIINIESSWGEISSAKSDLNGNWITEIDTPDAGGPYSLKISDGIKTKKFQIF